MARALLPYALPLLMWTVAAIRAPALHRYRCSDLRVTSWINTVAVALALTARLPPVVRLIEQVSGVPHSARLLEHGFALVATWAAQAIFISLNYPGSNGRRRARSLAIGLAFAFGFMLCLWFTAGPERLAEDFWTAYADQPLLWLYRLVFVACIGTATANLVRLCWRYAGMSTALPVRIGLRVAGMGGTIGVVGAVNEVAQVTARRFGAAYPASDPYLITELCLAVGLALMTTGLSMPMWAPRAAAIWRWCTGIGPTSVFTRCGTCFRGPARRSAC